MDSRTRWAIVAFVLVAQLAAAASASAALFVEQPSYIDVGGNVYEVRYRTGGDETAQRIDLFVPQGNGPASNIVANPDGNSGSIAFGSDTAVFVNFFNPVTPGTSGTVRFTHSGTLSPEARIGVSISNSSGSSPMVDASRDTSQPPPGGGGGGGGGGQPQPEPQGAPDLAIDLTGPETGTIFAASTYQITVTNVGTARSAGGAAYLSGEGEGGAFGPLLGMKSTVLGQDGSSTGEDCLRRFMVVTPDNAGPAPTNAGPEDLFAGLGSMTVPPLDRGASVTGTATLVNSDRCLVDELRRSNGTVTLRARIQPLDGPPGPDLDHHTTRFTSPPPPKHDTNQTKQPATQPAKDLKAISGSSTGDIQRVDVGVLQLLDGARPAAAGCRSLSSARGRFTRLPLTNRRCTAIRWLRAKGTKKWSFKLRKTLPKGRYVIYSRAVGKDGVPELSFTARDRNRQIVRLR